VADLGVRAACDLAEKRKLPPNGYCLQISVGDRPLNALELSQGEISAWVWEDTEYPGFFHIASWADRLSADEDSIFVTGTKKPITKEASSIIFGTIDEFLFHRFAEMRFELLPLTIRGRVAREVALELVHPALHGETHAGAIGIGGRAGGSAT
jgi:hypothetical protein